MPNTTPDSTDAQQIYDLVSLVTDLRDAYIELAGNLAAQLPEDVQAGVGQHVAMVATDVESRMARIVGSKQGGDDHPKSRDLTAFVRARLDGWEKDAHRWHDMECGIHAADREDLAMYATVPGAICDCGAPIRVLRQVEALRVVVDGAPERDQLVYDTIRRLATVWQDHPDYPRSATRPRSQ